MDFFFSAPFVPFSTAILIMLGIGLLEVIGLGFSALDIDAHIDHTIDGDIDLDGGHNIDVLGWLGIGHVPFMAVVVSFLTLFGLLGFAIQNLAISYLDHPLRLLFAIPAALLASLPLTGIFANGLGRIMPRDETTSISQQELIGKRATLILGSAQPGSPTKAKIKDQFGQTHYVLVEPDFDIVHEGDELLLVRKEGDVYVGVSPNPSYTRPV